VSSGDTAEVRRLIQSGVNVNARCDEGASVLFLACLNANVEMVQLLLDLGADPNLIAEEPASGKYCEKVLDMVMQAQFLMHWDIYTLVFDALVSKGATQSDGTVPNAKEEAARRRRAYELQAGRDPWASKKSWWKFW
jgi:hypothetical protein